MLEFRGRLRARSTSSVSQNIFSHISGRSSCGKKRVLQIPFHRSLSTTHSSLMFQAFGSLLVVSFHFNVGLPLGRFPSIFILTTAWMFSESSLLLTCSNHSSLLLPITIVTGSTFSSSKSSSFRRMYDNKNRLIITGCSIHSNDLGVTKNANMKISEQCIIAASKGNPVLALIRRSTTCQENGSLAPLYKAMVTPHLEYCIHAW